jgi:uncharacterized membrane protein YccC
MARPEAGAVSAKIEWPVPGLFSDLRVRYGIKLGLAAVIALYWALLLRLEHPNWSVFTVVILMSSQHVGAISVKVIMRLVGTISGSVLGVWLVGSYDTSPVVLLSGIFFIVALATYKFGQFPASQVPYAYFLVGLTLLSVSTYGVPAPDQIWQIAINRSLENIVGALSALVVTTVVWPRHAREEFFEAARTALETCGKLLAVEANSYIHQREGAEGVKKVESKFARDLATVRNLLQVGARESTNFRARIANFNAFLVALTDLFQSAVDLERRCEDESHILEQLRDELDALDAAIAEEFSVLTQRRPAGVRSPPSRLTPHLERLEERINSMRTAPDSVLRTSSTEVLAVFLGHVSALRAVCNDLANIRDALEGLPRHGQPLPEHKVLWDYLPTIDWFWVKNGIKGGLAAVVALVVIQSFNPPGSTVIPLAAWAFTILSRGFLRAGGAGDLGIFQRAFVAAVLFIPLAALLLVITPFLVDYAAMSLFLFGILFVFGFFTARNAGLGFWTQIGNFTVNLLVALNPQVPVPSTTIIDTFLGFAAGIAIAAVVGRLLWPVLPQEVFREDMRNMFIQLKALLNRSENAEKIRTQLAILPVEAQQAARHIRSGHCSAEEQSKITRLIAAAQRLVAGSLALTSDLHVLQHPLNEALQPELERLRVEFSRILDAFAECFRKGDTRRDFPRLSDSMAKLAETIRTVRESGALAKEDLSGLFRSLEIVNRYQSIADALEECRSIIQALQLHRYVGDYRL